MTFPILIKLVLMALLGVGGHNYTHAPVSVYNAPGNAGIVIGWPDKCQDVGYEWRGVPGFYVNQCD